MAKLLAISLFLVISFGTKSIRTEIFTALAEMEELLETEAVLINNLEGYLEVQAQKIEYLKL